MPDAPLLVGIDIGTTSIKAIVFDAQGQIVASAANKTPTHFPRPGPGLLHGRRALGDCPCNPPPGRGADAQPAADREPGRHQHRRDGRAAGRTERAGLRHDRLVRHPLRTPGRVAGRHHRRRNASFASSGCRFTPSPASASCSGSRRTSRQPSGASNAGSMWRTTSPIASAASRPPTSPSPPDRSCWI